MKLNILSPIEYGEEALYNAINTMLKRLYSEYIDLLLLHHSINDCIGSLKVVERTVIEEKVYFPFSMSVLIVLIKISTLLYIPIFSFNET